MRKTFAKYLIVLLLVISSTITNAQTIKTFLQGYSSGLARHKDVKTAWAAILNGNGKTFPVGVYTNLRNIVSGNNKNLYFLFYLTPGGNVTSIY